jgi:hypothetical protein
MTEKRMTEKRMTEKKNNKKPQNNRMWFKGGEKSNKLFQIA